MPDRDDLSALRAENARLIALLGSHGIEWRPPQPVVVAAARGSGHRSCECSSARTPEIGHFSGQSRFYSPFGPRREWPEVRRGLVWRPLKSTGYADEASG